MSQSADTQGANSLQANKSTSPSGKVGLISLGCPKALVDSERIVTQLRSDGYEIVPTYDSADLVLVNTCGFIDEAKQESLEAIGEALNANGKVIVTGCLGAQAETITEQHPGVLAVTGPQQYEQVMQAVHQHLPPKANYDHRFDLVPAHGIKLTPRHYAYLKISEGCNHSCSFCIIPSMRGKLVSRPIGDVLDEAKALADAGVKELLVISQDTSAYGVDIKYRTGFWQGRPIKSQLYDLCSALGELGIWVRLHYVYPYPNVDKIIPLMAEGKILPYLDIPLQHGSPKILKAMRRPAHTENTLKRIEKWREICPEITIRSTFIVGFPGETDQDFEELLTFIQAARLDRVGCFKYSPVEGAGANDLADPVSESVKQARFEAFMETQQAISKEKLAAKVNSTVPVIIDGLSETEDGEPMYIARSSGDAPEIDGLVYVDADRELSPGDRVSVTITHADDYDLWGKESL